jgi:putative endopeptidase
MKIPKTRNGIKNNKKRKGHQQTRKTYRELSTGTTMTSNALCHSFKPFESEYEKTHKKSLKDSDVEKTLITMFKTPFSPSKITPQNDFYTYINYRWLTTTELNAKNLPKTQKYFVQIDDFRLTQHKVYQQLIDIVDDYTKNNHCKKANMIRNIYTSLLTLDPKVAQDHIHVTVKEHDEKIKENDLWKFLAHINSNEIISWGCPIYWMLMADEKNSTTFKNYINVPELSLYNTDLYFSTEELPDELPADKQYRLLVQKKFVEYVDNIFDACLGKNHGMSGKDVFDVEREIVNAMSCDDKKIKESVNFYNVVTKEESLSKYGFDWIQFATHLGYSRVPDTFICSGLNYLKCICTIMKEQWTTLKWRSYWTYIYLRQIIRFDKNLIHIHYDFNGKFIHGIPEQFPWEIYPIFGLSVTFNNFLTAEYVKKYSDQSVINYTKNMGEDLTKIFKRIIERNTWLSPKTKKYALLKLEHITFDIVQPRKMTEDPILEYRANDPWYNLLLITKWRTRQNILLNGKSVVDVPMVSWDAFKLVGQQAYIVNAMYTPTLNSIYIPLGYLQKPFVDLDERGIEYNLSHIGYTIAHELSHSLDDMGSQYDYKGNLFNWWTEKDRRIYEAKQRDIIKQYETFASYDGLKFDAVPSIGEDLADISGVAICQEYLRDFQDKNQDIVPIRSLSFQAFYTYFAMQNRQHIYKEAILAQLKTNPHPPDKYRSNVPLSRLKLFRSLYNIKEGDKMWWHSTDTVW